MYWSTGSQAFTTSGSKGASSLRASVNRRWYQDESTKVSIVSVSRRAGPAHFGQWVFTQSVAVASGEVAPSVGSKSTTSGRVTGRSSSGTGTMPHSWQYTTGIGVPQKRCREISQSRSRNWISPRPISCSSRWAITARAPSSEGIPVNSPEPTITPVPG